MPKVYLTKQDKLNNELVALIYGTMKVKHVTQKQIADRLFISQPAFYGKLKKKRLTYEDLVTVFEMLEFTDEQILSVMRERGSNEKGK
jgi:predicted XRE-type DNA-binding protein